METVLAYLLRWPSLERLIASHSWIWPLCEVAHFVGLSLLVGIVGMFDLRLLGVAKDLPVAPLRRLLPWAVLGFVLCLASGAVFVGGLWANAHMYADDVLRRNVWLQLKLLFIALAGLNLVAFYATRVSRLVDTLGPGDEAPVIAKVMAGTSLGLWVGVMYFGRMIPWGL